MRGDKLISLLGAKSSSKKDLRTALVNSRLEVGEISYLISTNTFPSGNLLSRILDFTKLSLLELKVKCGFIDSEVLDFVSSKSEALFGDQTIDHRRAEKTISSQQSFQPEFTTELGELYQGDCVPFLQQIEDESVDLVFADPPFNLGKLYPSKMNDNISEDKYIEWCEAWLFECVRVLKPGGSLFLWNIPRWNTILSAYLNQFLTFRHWIATDIKYSLPISGRLYPSHYSLLYYCKGKKPNTFSPDRMMMEVCNNCYKELKDYGGYKSKMNPDGINMTDVWYDIPPVRHRKFMGRTGSNELSLKLLDRIIEMASNPGDTVLDPFGGSGTTYVAAEIKNRRWIGVELGPLDDIIFRFNRLPDEEALIQKYRANYNALFPDNIKRERIKRRLWTDDSFNKDKQPIPLRLFEEI